MSITLSTLFARLASTRALLCVVTLFAALSFPEQAHATPIDVTFTIQRVRSCCDNFDRGDPFFKLFAPAIGVSLRTPVHDGVSEGQFSNYNESFKLKTDTDLTTLDIEVEQWDDDQAFNGQDNRIDMTGPGGDTVRIQLDLVNKSWKTTNGNFCSGPLDAFGGCTAGKTQGPDDFGAADDDGGMEWTISFSTCGVPFIDSDGDGLFDQWEISGIDTDCDGTIDVPIHTFGANPQHKDIFFEYDWCSTTPPQRSAVQNVKAAFAAAPVDATGIANPDGLPGINLWLDTGSLVDPTADEGRPSCADGIDNDLNGAIDAADATCVGRFKEGPFVAGTAAPGTCTDSIDNDADGVLDGNDPDCLVGDDLGGGNAIACPARGIPNLNGPDNCDRSVNPANTCTATGVNTGTCSVGGAACVPENGFFSILRGPNFDADRAVAFRYVVQAPGADGQAIEDGVGLCGNMREDSRIPSDGVDGADIACLLGGAEDGVLGGCFNTVDDRADGTIDRLDTDCNRNEDGGPPGSCYDTVDNSADGADRADAQCAAMREDGGGANSCFDGVDNGNPLNIPFLGDGADSADTQCRVVEDGVAGATCYNGRDDQADGFRDGADPDCSPMVEDGAGAGSCYDRVDNSGDGADRRDPDCAGLAENGAGPGSCYDGIENIWDGADGADPDCNFGGGWGGGDNIILFNADPGGGTLMHEIGHTLGLGHGGGDGNNCKPNYVSVMNYDLQMGISQQPGHAVEGSLLLLVLASEDGGPPGSCMDGVDNGGMMGMDGIDLLDPDCQTCLDTIDNDGDMLIDGNDTDCLGIDNNADGTPDQFAIDFSPPRFPGGRAQVLPDLIETSVTEAQSLVSIDTDGDGAQDVPTDPINLIAFHPFNSTAGSETPTGGAAECSDGIDNNFDGFVDQLDVGCVGAATFAPIFGLDLTGDGIPDGLDWNMDGNATGVVTVNADGGPDDDCQNGRFLAGLAEDGVAGACADGIDNGGTGDGTDAADTDCRIAGFDDWSNINLRTEANGGPGSAVPTLREPTTQELRANTFEARAADLVLDSTQTVIPVAADGSVTLEVAVENVSPTPAWGPVRLVIQGLPSDVTVQSALGVCAREGADVVCTRGWLLGYEVWDLQLKLGAGQCAWIATDLHLSVLAHGGREITPIDNELDLAVDAGGAWPMWKLCGSRWGEAPYNGPVGSSIGWSRAMISPMRSSVMVASNGSLYVVTVTGMLYSLNSNGTVRWNRLVGANINGSPALTPSGLVVVASTLGSVLAFRQTDGAPMWSWFGTSLINGSPAVASDGTIYVSSGLGLNGDSLIALTSTGTLKWRLPLGGSSSSSVALGGDGTIYVTTSSLFQQARLIAVSPAGAQLWSAPIGNSSKSSPTVRNGRVYIGNDQGQVLALNATTGTIAWTYQMTCPLLQSCRVESSPVVSGLGEVIFGASNGTVIALQGGAQSATFRWSVNTQAPIAGSPILSNNRIVYIGAGTRVYALRADTGAQAFRSQTFGIIAGTPSLTPTGTLLIGSDDNFVRAFTGP